MSAEQRRISIVGAAMQVFARKGFAGSTTKELAAAAGVSEALLYRHFDSKEAILEAIQDFICDRQAPVIDNIQQLPESTEGLVFVIFAVHRMIASRSGVVDPAYTAVLRLMLQSSLEDGHFVKSFHDSRFARLLPYFKKCANAARKAGDLHISPMSDAEKFWFAHHMAVAIGLAELTPELPYDYNQADPLTRRHNAFIFSLQGIGLSSSAIKIHARVDHLLALFDQVTAEN